MRKPYVISAELDIAKSDTVKPKSVETFRESLDYDLRNIGKDTLWVPSGTMQSGMQKLLSRTNLPIVSLDDRYITEADQFLGISRGVDTNLNDIGYVARAGYRSISQQLEQMCRLGREVAVADDVLFSGEMIDWLAEELRRRDVKIGGVVCGIAIGTGVKRLASQGIDIEAVVEFDNVDDEICERDFAIVPGSGRRVSKLSANALYFDNINGKPEEWASLPAVNTESFCRNSLERNLALLRPELPMKNVGRFLGYGQDGLVSEQIRNRIGETK